MRDVFESADPDFNEAEGVTCPECKAPYEMVRPGKIQPTCLCEAYRVECANHQSTRETLEQLRAKLAQSEKELVTIPIDRAASDEMDAYMLAQHQKEPTTIIKPAWVPCRERMPPESGLVLAWSPSQGYFMVTSFQGGFISIMSSSDGAAFTLPADISHWTLLPKAPHA